MFVFRFYPHIIAPSQTRLTTGQRVRLDRDSGIPRTSNTQYHHSNHAINKQSADEKKHSFKIVNMNDIALPKPRYVLPRRDFMF